MIEPEKIAISVLREYRSAIARSDFHQSALLYSRLARLPFEEFQEVQLGILSRMADPDRDYIIHIEASEDRIVSIWRFEPDDPDMMYLMPIHFRKTDERWTIDRKAGPSGSGPLDRTDQKMTLELHQEVEPEVYTLNSTAKPNDPPH